MSSRPEPNLSADLSGLNCPLPILRTKKALAALEGGQLLQVTCTDPATPTDFAAFCKQTGHTLVEHWQAEGKFLFLIQKRSA
ncbi:MULTISPECIES: sulfurtransferase TusA family protein [Chitinibacter]|uniref:sulfurtransferase TusA family protein n=1 Tax=Chitinibacter TaxID=230666 RepID=UPI00040C20CE|nr:MULTISPECIES: sulfurtransferase TusA family protein [Chitinibacter]